MSTLFRLLSLVISGVVAAIPGVASAQSGSKVAIDWPSVKLESIGEGLLPTAQYKGKVVLVVNTASLCGFTDQYAGLEALWRRYKDQGFVLLGVPSNDFGGQEPGTRAEIKNFCVSTFDVTFPLADKQVVTGESAHPLYKWIAAQAGPLGAPKWNFHKYLVGRDGNLVDWYSAMTGPGATAIDDAIRKALAAQGT
jgi:glutathione peroxidase